MLGRTQLLDDLIQQTEDILVALEDRRDIEADFSTAIDAAEVLQEELRNIR